MIIKSNISAKLPVGIKNRIIKNTPANSSHTPMAYTTIRAISPLIILFTATPTSPPLPPCKTAIPLTTKNSAKAICNKMTPKFFCAEDIITS